MKVRFISFSVFSFSKNDEESRPLWSHEVMRKSCAAAKPSDIVGDCCSDLPSKVFEQVGTKRNRSRNKTYCEIQMQSALWALQELSMRRIAGRKLSVYLVWRCREMTGPQLHLFVYQFIKQPSAYQVFSSTLFLAGPSRSTAAVLRMAKSRGFCPQTSSSRTATPLPAVEGARKH